MSVKPIPDGYHTVTPYLVVEGAARVIDFAQAALGAKQRYRMDMPNGMVAHAEIEIGDSPIMVADAPGGAEGPPMPAMLYVYVSSVDEVYKQSLAAGGASIREPSDEFYGDRVAGVRDPAGNQWWLSTHVEDVSPEEMARRAQQRAAQES